MGKEQIILLCKRVDKISFKERKDTEEFWVTDWYDIYLLEKALGNCDDNGL